MRGRLPVILSYTGSAAAANLAPIGFKPKFIEIFNETDGFMCAMWYDGLPDANYYKVVAAGTQSLVTSNGLTVGGSGEITVGSDAGLNANAKVYKLIAY